MGLNPDYTATIDIENTDEVLIGALLKGAVGRENVVPVSGEPTADDAFPTAGRVAADTSSDPPTYYIGDGDAWQVVETWAQLQSTLGESTSTSGVSPGFGTWTEADPDRGTIVTAEATAETDGTDTAEVGVAVDESGEGGPADYTVTIVESVGDNSAGVSNSSATSLYIPPGAQYQFVNIADPNNGNTTGNVREAKL